MAKDDPELPGYTARAAPQAGPAAAGASRTEHKWSLESKGRAWLFLFVHSRSPTATSPPFYFEGDSVSGRVELDLDKSESLKGVVIGIQAGVTAVGQEEQLFLNLNEGLWAEKSGKLPKGKHSWPFMFALPSKVSSPDAKGLMLPTPPSFSERASPAYIDFRIVATVKRGAFKVNQTLTTNFAYLPLTQPAPPSALRQLAYQEGSELIGPDGDPGGWKVLQPLKIRGKLFDAKEVEVECTLAIATPLCYTIGSPIPLVLTLKSEDNHALDTLATTQAIKLYLVRSVALGSSAMDEDAERMSNSFFLSGAGQATFWPSTEGAPEPGIRTLRGELDVKKTVKPNFLFSSVLNTGYTLDLLPFSVTGFTSLGTEPGKAMLSEPVKITTKQVLGVTPRSYAPPGYEKPVENDYNSAVGYLENGNQRFYHHGGFS